MSEFIVPDCLVLKIEEVEEFSNKIDTTLYIIYDIKNEKYSIRGMRRSTPSQKSCTYSFDCKYSDVLADFIQYLICPDNRVNEILFNYNNLPEDTNDITFSFLRENESPVNEISGYNNKKVKKERLMRILGMLRNVYNVY